jgi:hypothetical protein
MLVSPIFCDLPTGCEGRISVVKRRHGLGRSRYKADTAAGMPTNTPGERYPRCWHRRYSWSLCDVTNHLKVEQWPIERLIEYARNPRKNAAAVDQMAGAIREFGFRIPIVAKSDGSVIDGHLRLKAARKLGLTEVPVALADELTDAQIKAFRLLANRSASWAEWDTELLRLELGDLKELGFNLTLTGFDDIELGSLLADKTDGLTDPDDAPAVPEHPVSQTGDLWLLGRHRLLCGDSTVATDVERVLGGRGHRDHPGPPGRPTRPPVCQPIHPGSATRAAGPAAIAGASAT